MGGSSQSPSSRDHELRDLIIKKDLKIDKLESENASLRDQLTAARRNTTPDADLCRDDRQPDEGAEVTDDSYTDLHRRHLELQRLFDDLQCRHAKCDPFVKQATAKYVAAKESARQWKAYVDSRIVKKTAGEAVTPAPVLPLDVSIEVANALASNDQNITPKASVPPVACLPNATTGRQDSTSSLDLPAHATELPFRSSPPASDGHLPQVTSSQTTEGDENFVEDDRHVMVKQEPDDEPVVVSARTVKRQRSRSEMQMPPPRKIKRERALPDGAGSAEKPFQLKSDEYSPPRPAHTLQGLQQEMSDLDHLNGSLRTPRRRLQRNSVFDRAVSEEATQPPTLRGHGLLRKTSSSLSDGDLPDVHDLMQAKRNPTIVGTAVQQPAVHDQGDPVTAESRTRRRSDERAPLRRLSPNVRSIPRTGRQRLGRYDDPAVKAGCLAEDGDETTSQVVTSAKVDSAPAVKSASAQRLDAMLSDNTPSRAPLQRRLPPTSRKSLSKRSTPPTSNVTIIKTEPSAAPAQPESARFRLPRGLIPAPPPVRPEEEPLRLRHPSTLTTSDFRINPAYQSTDFAFADTIRGRESRRCLPNCTLPTCCGGRFLEMARAGALPPTSKSRSEVLEGYLGANWEAIMSEYDDAKRRETVLEAQAHDFAAAHGKHKEVFTRRASPPGYWDTGMPSTQEEEANKAKAKSMHRERIEGMRREAMRGGGRWLFRDE